MRKATLMATACVALLCVGTAQVAMAGKCEAKKGQAFVKAVRGDLKCKGKGDANWSFDSEACIDAVPARCVMGVVKAQTYVPCLNTVSATVACVEVLSLTNNDLSPWQFSFADPSPGKCALKRGQVLGKAIAASEKCAYGADFRPGFDWAGCYSGALEKCTVQYAKVQASIAGCAQLDPAQACSVAVEWGSVINNEW